MHDDFKGKKEEERRPNVSLTAPECAKLVSPVMMLLAPSFVSNSPCTESMVLMIVNLADQIASIVGRPRHHGYDLPHWIPHITGDDY